MFNLTVQKIGRLAVVHCVGRIVRSDAAFRLRHAVRQQTAARTILLDLSGVEALEGGGLGMLLFLHLWTRNHGIQLKVMNPIACCSMEPGTCPLQRCGSDRGNGRSAFTAGWRTTGIVGQLSKGRVTQT